MTFRDVELPTGPVPALGEHNYMIIKARPSRRGSLMTLLNDRVAAILGAAHGIGFAIAEQFVAHGAKVVVGDVDLGLAGGPPRSSADPP
jgi:hypothetical protein